MHFPLLYLGPISYYAEMIKAKKVVFDLGERYQKQSLRNRCSILTPNGPFNLVVPLKKSSLHMPIHKVEIDNTQTWQRDHWRALVSAYNSSPFFMYYDYLFEALYAQKFELISEFNMQLHKVIESVLQNEIHAEYTSESTDFIHNDIRIRYGVRAANITTVAIQPYQQVFSRTSNEFVNDLSIMDLIFNEGPVSQSYLLKLSSEL